MEGWGSMARSFSSIDTAEAISLLNQIITDLPGTWIADLARQLRDEI